MKLGIVGLPNVGKSTLFNSLTKAGAESANYPFCTIDPNVGVVTVPDERLNVLGEMYHTKKIIPAAIEFVDIAGLVKARPKERDSATSSLLISVKSMQSCMWCAALKIRISCMWTAVLIRCAISRRSIWS